MTASTRAVRVSDKVLAELLDRASKRDCSVQDVIEQLLREHDRTTTDSNPGEA